MDQRIIRDWVFIILVLGIGIYLISFLKSEANQCLKEPLIYGLNSIIEQNEFNNGSCSCSISENTSCICYGDKELRTVNFLVTPEEITPLLLNRGSINENLDYPSVDDLINIINQTNASIFD